MNRPVMQALKKKDGIMVRKEQGRKDHQSSSPKSHCVNSAKYSLISLSCNLLVCEDE